jgi:hypothetical protein
MYRYCQAIICEATGAMEHEIYPSAILGYSGLYTEIDNVLGNVVCDCLSQNWQFVMPKIPR